MINRIALIEAFKDTQRMIRENRELADLTLKMQAGTALYLDKFEAVNRISKRKIRIFPSWKIRRITLRRLTAGEWLKIMMAI